MHTFVRGTIYFNSLVRMGYNIDVVQSRYISLCPDKENGTDDEPVSEAVRCYDYSSDAIGLLRLTHGLSERLDALWSAYLRRSYRFRRALYYYRVANSKLVESGITLPDLWRPDFTPSVAPIVSLMTIDTLADRMKSLGPGQALVAHLILPHGPYVYRADCSIGSSTGERDRNELYKRYFEQLDCLYAKLETLVAQMRVVGIYESPDIKVGRSQRTGSTCAVSPAHLSSSNNHRLNTLRRLLAAAEQAPQPERGLRRRPSTEARKYCSGRSPEEPVNQAVTAQIA